MLLRCQLYWIIYIDIHQKKDLHWKALGYNDHYIIKWEINAWVKYSQVPLSMVRTMTSPTRRPPSSANTRFEEQLPIYVAMSSRMRCGCNFWLPLRSGSSGAKTVLTLDIFVTAGQLKILNRCEFSTYLVVKVYNFLLWTDFWNETFWIMQNRNVCFFT